MNWIALSNAQIELKKNYYINFTNNDQIAYFVIPTNLFLSLIEVFIYWEVITENLDADIISTIMFGITLFFYRSVELWNKLPDELVSCEKVEHFRLRLKKFDLNKYFVSKIYK